MSPIHKTAVLIGIDMRYPLVWNFLGAQADARDYPPLANQTLNAAQSGHFQCPKHTRGTTIAASGLEQERQPAFRKLAQLLQETVEVVVLSVWRG